MFISAFKRAKWFALAIAHYIYLDSFSLLAIINTTSQLKQLLYGNITLVSMLIELGSEYYEDELQILIPAILSLTIQSSFMQRVTQTSVYYS